MAKIQKECILLTVVYSRESVLLLTRPQYLPSSLYWPVTVLNAVSADIL